MSEVRLGTRGSALARWQSAHVASMLARLDPAVRPTLVEIVSAGDRLADVPLPSLEGTGFFTTTLEQALFAGEVDIAVHSYKDLPVEATAGLVVAAVPLRGPVEDVLCGPPGFTLQTLPPGVRIGTCSARRTAQLRARRRDAEIVPVRGNVPTRLARIGAAVDAVVLARAGLHRLELEHHVTEVFPVTDVLPAPAQGALAVQCRRDDVFLRQWLARLDDERTRRAVDAERALLHALGGGCTAPVGAVARLAHRTIALTAGVFDMEGLAAVRIEVTGREPHQVAADAAAQLMASGAGELLRRAAAASMSTTSVTTGRTR